MRLDGQFTVKVNKYGKKTCEYINALKFKRTSSEIIITDICGKVNKFDRTIYEAKRIYND